MSDKISIKGKASWENKIQKDEISTFSPLEVETLETSPLENNLVLQFLNLTDKVQLNKSGLKKISPETHYSKKKQYWLLPGLYAENVVGTFFFYRRTDEILIQFKGRTDRKKVYKRNIPILVILDFNPSSIFHDIKLDIVSINQKNLQTLDTAQTVPEEELLPDSNATSETTPPPVPSSENDTLIIPNENPIK